MADFSDDAPTIYRSRECRTRKERRCDECSRKIAPGEHYQNAFMVYEGHGDTFVTCEHCLVAQQWLNENCGGFLHAGVWEDIHEHVIEYPTLARHLRRLEIGRERQWERFDRTGLMAVPRAAPTLEQVGLGH